MNEPTLKDRQLKILNETCAHFNDTNRSTDLSGLQCVYSGVGCAIGRLIKDKALCKELDDLISCSSAVSNDDVFNRLPEDLKSLGQKFLVRLQHLHDSVGNWTETGLSENGQRCKDNIIREFDLTELVLASK